MRYSGRSYCYRDRKIVIVVDDNSESVKTERDTSIVESIIRSMMESINIIMGVIMIK